MSKPVFILLILFSSISCNAQNKTEEMNRELKNTGDMPLLTEANYVDTLLSVIKRYPKEPKYYFHVAYTHCIYEILVNDDMVTREYNYDGQIASPTFINPSILRSGTQRLTYRLYPIGRDGMDKLDDLTSFEIRIAYLDNRSDDIKETEVIVHKAPETTHLSPSGNFEVKSFAGSGEAYYEGSFIFEATVPYENEGWLNGQNLLKLDQDTLLKEIIKCYQKQWDICNNKAFDAMFSYFYKKESEVRQSIYSDQKDLEETKEMYIEDFSCKDFEMQPIQDFKPVFYGDGRMIALEQTSMDLMYRGGSALWGKFIDDEGDEVFNYRPYCFYLPKGKELKAENFILIR